MEYFLNYTIVSSRSKELEPLFAGYERCNSGHRFGPFVRHYYLIHFCLSGKGIFFDKYGTHEIAAGQQFLILPGEVTVYEADAKDPWEYCWIAFTGTQADVFLNGPSVCSLPASSATKLLEAVRRGENCVEWYLSFLYELIYSLFRKNTNAISQDARIVKAHQYIDYHYMQKLRVEELAKEFGFERSYFYRLFKKQFGIGVKSYITRVRMQHAKELLGLGHTVGDVAHMVGYDDLFHFSKSYKAHFGVTPSKRN